MNPHMEPWYKLSKDARLLQIYTDKVKELDAPLGSFLSFNPLLSHRPDLDDSLQGIPIGVKDNIAVKDRPLTCASKILENFQSPYSATVVEKLEQSGAFVVGKTNLDEFGMGSSTENSALGKTVNPWNLNKVPGGSSGGSAVAVAAGFVPLALGSDTGGSVRQPANFCGIYGLKPTYGSVSRYGLTAYASSLEVIGLFTRNLPLMEHAFSLISGMDDWDQSTVLASQTKKKNRKVAILKVDEGTLDEAVARACRDAAETLKEQGYELTSVDIPSLQYAIPTYLTIATAEASSNLARYNGMRYGKAVQDVQSPLELMRKVRHEGFGNEVKLRILLGTYALRSGFQDQYYGKAQKMRTLIRRELTALYEDCDFVLMPVFPTQAFNLGDSVMDEYQQRLADLFTSLANLAGFPALSVPIGIDGGLPTGVQLMTPPFTEERLFRIAETLGHTFPLQHPERFLEIGSLV